MQESIYLSHNKKLEETIINFFSRHQLTFYKKGEIINRSDIAASTIFCSKSGYIIVYSISPKGHRDVRSIGGASCLFPLSNFFTPEHTDEFMSPRITYFEALTDSYIWHAPSQEFDRHLEQSEETQSTLFKQYSMNHRLTMARIEMMQVRDIQVRIASLLLTLALSFGDKQGNECAIQVPLSHQLIADSISTARETVSRELTKLKQIGLVRTDGASMTLVDVEKLKKMIEAY